MKDLVLWRLLTRSEPVAETDELQSLLQQLGELDLEDRTPYLGLVLPLAQHTQPKIRQHALQALRGAKGRPVLRALLKAFDDEEPAVRQASATSFVESVQHDPARHIHTAFHPRNEIREVVWQVPKTLPDWFLPCLIADPAHGGMALEQARATSLKPDSIPVVLDLLRNKHLRDSEARHLIAGTSPKELMGWLNQMPAKCSSETIQKTLGRMSQSGSVPPTPLPAEDILDSLIRLYWNSGENEVDATIIHSFFRHLTQGLLDRQYRQLVPWVVLAVYRAAIQSGTWILPAAELCNLFWPTFAQQAWIPAQIRNDALITLYDIGDRCPTIHHRALKKLVLSSPFIRKPSGQIRLLELGAHLHRIKKARYRSVQDWFSTTEILEAAREDLVASVPFFRLSDSSHKYRSQLIHEASLDHPDRATFLAHLCYQLPADGIDHLLASPAGVEGLANALEILGEVIKLEKVRGFAPTEQRSTVVVQALAAEFAKEPKHFLQHLCGGGQSEMSEFTLEVLRLVARQTPTRRFVKAVGQCDAPQQEALMAMAQASIGFPVDVLLALGKAFPQPENPKPCRIKESHPEQPRPSVQAHISDLEKCLSLIPSRKHHSKIDREIARLGVLSSDFLQRLEASAYASFGHRTPSHVGLLGHAWLHRYEAHLLPFGDLIEKKGLGKVLEETFDFQVPVLAQQLWEASAHLFGVLQARDRNRIPRLWSQSLGAVLVEGLKTEHAVSAASCLKWLFRSRTLKAELDLLEPQILKYAEEIGKEARPYLKDWIDLDQFGPAATRRPRPQSPDATLLKQVESSKDLDQLQEWCGHQNLKVVTAAAYRLIELGEPGVNRLTQVLRDAAYPACAHEVASTISLWPICPDLDIVRDLVHDSSIDPQLRFIAATELVKRGERGLEEALMAAVCAPTEESWFRRADWRCLLDCSGSERVLALRLATCWHPSAYRLALDVLLAQDTPAPEAEEAVRQFLECGTDRVGGLRLKAALWLRDHEDSHGLPLLIANALQDATDPEFCQWLPRSCLDPVVSAAVALGTQGQKVLTRLLDRPGVPTESRQQASECLLAETPSETVLATATRWLSKTPKRGDRLTAVAHTFLWGMRTGQELLARLFRIEMLTGESLGYTRLSENRIWVNVLPILRGEKNGKSIVQGLIVHEFGHHKYNSGRENEAIWDQAVKEGLSSLFNLVADEHLERNLRAEQPAHGDRLKHLAAYAFRHSQREIQVEELLHSLGSRAFSILSRIRMVVARKEGHVQMTSGHLLRELNRQESSLARFVTALRMGLGNRDQDPRVAEALALFGGDFRHNHMRELLIITRELRRIFGHEATILEAIAQDSALSGEAAETVWRGRGITDQEIKDEIARIQGEKSKRTPQSKDCPPTLHELNLSPEEDVATDLIIIPAAYDPKEHRILARQVGHPASQLRRYLMELGITHVPERRRIQGKRLDPTRVPALVIRSDPRVMIARRRQNRRDLFLGILIDCSGSMRIDDNIHKARLFGALVAEAVRNLDGVDLRIFGFTDSEIIDAGDASRPAVHALEAYGGNDDAAALWHTAQIALRSKRSARLLVMISDGAPTECSVETLRSLVTRLSLRMGICCAQVAVRPLEEICFPHYIHLDATDLGGSVRQFGTTIAGLVRKALAR